MSQAPPPYPVGPSGAMAYYPPAPKRVDWARIATLVGIPLLLGASGVGVLLWIGTRIGGSALGIGLGAAIIPVPVLVACFIWLDRYEPEPIRNLVFCLAWGASVAAAGSIGLEWLETIGLNRTHLSQDLLPVLGAPLAEETMKALGPVLLLVVTKRRAFSGLVD